MALPEEDVEGGTKADEAAYLGEALVHIHWSGGHDLPLLSLGRESNSDIGDVLVV
jgi:hypothetical protein